MHVHLPLLLALGLSLSACGGGASDDDRRPTDSTARSGVAAADPTGDPPMTASSDAQPEGAYRLLGVLDPDRNNMVAFAMKVPRDWRVQQQFTRRWQGAFPLNQIYLRFTAPDGRSQIEYLPSTTYSYAEGPLIEQNRAMARSMGMPVYRAPDELQPMSPVAYIRQVLLPQLAQNGLQVRNVGNPQEAPQTRGENGRIESRGSVDGTLADGKRVRVECRLFVSTQQQQGNQFTSWEVIPSITQTSDDLAAVFAHTMVAQSSIVANPTWIEQNRQTQNRGLQANSELSRQQHEATMGQIESNTAAMTRAHNARMADIRRQGEANTARYNERMAEMDRNQAAYEERTASMDRQNEAMADGILGREKLVDPTTGDRIKIDVGPNHVYRDRQNPNIYYGTNTPIDPQKVDWQELQRVPVSDY